MIDIHIDEDIRLSVEETQTNRHSGIHKPEELDNCTKKGPTFKSVLEKLFIFEIVLKLIIYIILIK